MPLAIELAAARMQTFGVRGLTRALADRLRTLTSRQRTGLPRHRTLAALLDWSHQILPESDRTTLRRLSVFSGRFTLRSAQAVAADESLDAFQVMESIVSLSSKSMISTEVRQNEVRYRLLETTRAYALQKLVDRDEVSRFHLAHARHMCDLLDAGKVLESSMNRTEWVADCAWLIDDVRSALDWSFGPGGDVAVGMRLTAAAIPLCLHLSLLEEFVERANAACMQARSLEPPPDPLIEMRLNIAFAALTTQTSGPSPSIAPAMERALQLSEYPALRSFRGEALNMAWSVAFSAGMYERSVRDAQALAVLARENGDAAVVLTADRLLAQSRHFTGDHAASRTLAERVLSHPTRINRFSTMQPSPVDRRVSMRIVLARVHWIQGRIEQAAALAGECVEIARTDFGYGLCQALAWAACPVALWMDDRTAARAFARRLVEHGSKQRIRYWQRWGENFSHLLDERDAVDAGKPRGTPLKLDIANSEHKLRDMFGTVDVFDGDARTIERAEQGLCGWCAAEIHREHGEWLLTRSDAATAKAQELFETSLRIARDQGALSWELRTSMSLSRLLRRRGRIPEAEHLLATAYGQFSEGFKSKDLVEAKAMLVGMDE